MTTERNGFILITTLAVLAVLAAFSLGLSQQIRLHLAMERYHQDAAKANRFMKYGVTYAEHVLRSDADRNYPYQYVPVDGALIGVSENERLQVWTTELSGLFNINETPQEVIEEVLLQMVDNASEAEDVSAAIMDWRDPDSIGFAEEIYYRNLQLPYGPRNGPLRRLDELSLVKGVSELIYLGEDANHNLVLDPTEDDGDASMPMDNRDGVLQLGLRDYFSVREEEAININSAPAHIWLTIFRWALGVTERYRAAAMVERIMSFRAGSDGILGTVDDQQFSDEEGWKEALGTVDAELTDRIEGQFTFTVEPTGYVVRVRAALEAERISQTCAVWFVLDEGAPRIARYEVKP